MRRWGYGILGALIFAFLGPLGVMFGGFLAGVTLFATSTRTRTSTVEGIWVLIVLAGAVLAIPAGLIFGWR